MTLDIDLPDDMIAFIEEEMVAGGYASASEYFSNLVRQAKTASEE